VRYSLHRKGFLAGVVISSPKTHNSNQDKPFRFQFDDLPVNITLVQGLGELLPSILEWSYPVEPIDVGV
jgi:hypothetical protein